jgi:hypothetical protein
MFHRFHSTGAAVGAEQATAPRGQRGLGPFSGGQLTAIVITTLLVVGFPVGAFAVSGQNAFVTDTKTGAHAKVSSTGSLQTSIAGTVSATAQPPVGSFVKEMTGSECGLTPPAGKAWIITAVDEVPKGATSSIENIFNLLADTSAGCAGTQTSIASGYFALDLPRELTFNPGIGLSSGHYLDLEALSGKGGGVYVYGYVVSAAACATGCL